MCFIVSPSQDNTSPSPRSDFVFIDQVQDKWQVESLFGLHLLKYLGDRLSIFYFKNILRAAEGACSVEKNL